MALKFILLSQAELDRKQAFLWYSSQGGQKLQSRFYQAYKDTRNLILQFPEMYSVLKGNIRKASLSRFPFKIIYLIEKERIVVLAIAHSSKNTEYWTYEP